MYYYERHAVIEKNADKNTTKNVVWLGITSFLNDLSSEMILPILPLLIAQVGGTGIAIGLVGGLRDSAAEVLKALFGHWSDRIGKRKIFIYVGYLISAFFKFFLLLAHSWQLIFLLVGLERIGKAIRTAPRNALITQSVPLNIGWGFGFHQALDSLGALFGALTTFFLVWKLNLDFNIIILIAALICFTTILPLNKVTEAPTRTNNQATPFNVSSLSKSFKIFTLIASVFSLAHVSYMFLIVQAQNILPQTNAVVLSLFLYSLFNFVYSLLATPFGKLSDIIGRRKMVVLGYFVFALTMFNFFVATNIHLLVFGFMLYGIALAIIQVSHRAYAADLSPTDLKATGLGIFEAVTGLVTFIAGILAGVVWQFTQPTFVFGYAGALACIAGLLLAIFNPSIDQKQSRPL